MVPTTRLDAWMPHPLVTSHHAVTVDAPLADTYAALLDTDFSRHPLVVALMAARAVPAFLVAPIATWRKAREARARTAGRLKTMLSADFALLDEAPPHELVLGLTGRFWTPSGGLVPTRPETFREPVPAGLARVAWNFHLAPLDGGRTRLSTETRVACGDPATARRFTWYWRLIKPGSAAIRWAILGLVKHTAERAPARAADPDRA
jgi:hypothetical protein